MKTLNKLFLLIFSLIALGSCENYSDDPIEYSPIFPISGEWRCKVTDVSTSQLVANASYTFATYNTSDNSSTQMWIRTTANVGGGIGTIKGKISCNVGDLSFSGANIADITISGAPNPTGATFSITEGKISLNAISNMPSGLVTDKISFNFTTSKVPGKTFLFEGFRQTLWLEDQNFRDF